MSVEQEGRRPLLVAAAKTFLVQATAAGKGLDPRSPSWRFLQGVRTAALHVLHPDIAMVRRNSSWLAAEEAPFREGFLLASTALANAAVGPVPPTRVRMPLPPPERSSTRSA
jgi:hypothetical protein